MTEWIPSIFPYFITGVFSTIVAIIEVRSAKDRKRSEKAAETRALEMELSMEMQDATLYLSIVTSKAVETGKHNGELEEARKKAEVVKHKYESFLMQNMAKYVARA